MRVLYNTSVADPFVYVAKKMQDDYGYETVYWIGYDSDDSEELVARHLPNACYHPWRDAWKAIFPMEINRRIDSYALDVDMLKSMAVDELLSIKMMDRLDNDRYSFNYMERERHFLRLLKGWLICLDIYKPDIVISAVNPHRVYDYVLYVVCKYKGIPFLNFQHTLCRERTFCVDGCYSIGDTFESSYRRYAEGNAELEKDVLCEELKLQFERVQKNYEDAAPDYMRLHKTNAKKQSHWWFLAYKGITTYTHLGNNRIKANREFSLKKRGQSLEKSHFSLFDTAVMKLRSIQYKNRLKELYSSYVTIPDTKEDYILFLPHYQPEATTSPGGDIFVNQSLAIETLLKNTPDTYYIYVKEHPQQFQAHMAGQKSRIKEFYVDLITNPRIRFMPLEMDTYSLMRNAKAVSTITGTVGWEAVMHQKPVIIFGIVWYEKMPGVLRITDTISANEIMQFINGYCFDKHKITSYLKAFEDNTVYAYHYVGQKEKMHLSTDECVTSLSDYLYKQINKSACRQN